MQIPQPIQSVSEIHAILLCDVTSMQSFPGEKEEDQLKEASDESEFLPLLLNSTEEHVTN